MFPGNESFDEYDFPPALPIMGMLDHSQDCKYAPGIQTKVTGEVLKWHQEHGLQSFPAKEYIEKLERENQILKQQVKSCDWFHVCTSCILPFHSQVLNVIIFLSILQVSTQLYVHAAGNPLLNYLKGLEADSVKSLTIVSEDGVEAMNTFIHRLLGEHILLADMHARA